MIGCNFVNLFNNTWFFINTSIIWLWVWDSQFLVLSCQCVCFLKSQSQTDLTQHPWILALLKYSLNSNSELSLPFRSMDITRFQAFHFWLLPRLIVVLFMLPKNNVWTPIPHVNNAYCCIFSHWFTSRTASLFFV